MLNILQLSTYERIFNIESEEDFNQAALNVFMYQFDQNPIYRKFAQCFCKDPVSIKTYCNIPFLPISFFKTTKIITGNSETARVFRSSGTTGFVPSQHFVSDLSIYARSAIRSFELQFGSLKDFTMIALLPSYLEHDHSSLVWMCNLFISESNFKEDSGFFSDPKEVVYTLKKLINKRPRKILLLGVTYALLDLADKINFKIPDVVVMETGGMKGRRKEMVREELHTILCEKFGVVKIHSEYGMTELLSQAYSKGDGVFRSPQWMKILIREMNDPLSFAPLGKTGGINIIDLANINSCSFLATQDLGKLHADGTFEVLGRFDHSEVRGCNLMMNDMI